MEKEIDRWMFFVVEGMMAIESDKTGEGLDGWDKRMAKQRNRSKHAITPTKNGFIYFFLSFMWTSEFVNLLMFLVSIV